MAEASLPSCGIGGRHNRTDLPEDNCQPLKGECEIDEIERRRRLELTEQLLDQHYDSVFRYAYHLSGCSSSAEDIAQEVFVRAFCNVHQLRSMQAGLGWLLTITRHESFRHPKTKEQSLANSDWDPTLGPSHVRSIDRQEWIDCALRQLPEEFRIVVLMFYFEQKSYVEISEELGIPLGTVMSRLNRGRKHLKEALIAVGEPSSIGNWKALCSEESSDE